MKVDLQFMGNNKEHSVMSSSGGQMVGTVRVYAFRVMRPSVTLYTSTSSAVTNMVIIPRCNIPAFAYIFHKICLYFLCLHAQCRKKFKKHEEKVKFPKVFHIDYSTS